LLSLSSTSTSSSAFSIPFSISAPSPLFSDRSRSLESRSHPHTVTVENFFPVCTSSAVTSCFVTHSAVLWDFAKTAEVSSSRVVCLTSCVFHTSLCRQRVSFTVNTL
jgi:hypothetical protein